MYYTIFHIDLWSTDILTQNGKSERVKCAGCCILTSYIMKQNWIVQSSYSNAGLVRSGKSWTFIVHYSILLCV